RETADTAEDATDQNHERNRILRKACRLAGLVDRKRTVAVELRVAGRADLAQRRDELVGRHELGHHAVNGLRWSVHVSDVPPPSARTRGRVSSSRRSR